LNLNQIAIELLEENRFEEALNTFREAVRESRDVQTLNNLAWFLTNEEHDYHESGETTA
jgi:ferritin